MAENIPTPNFSGQQKTLLGIALAFYAIYKFALTDVGIVKSLGVAYPWFMMFWVMVMLTCFGFSGWEFAIYIKDAIKDYLKPKIKE